METVWIKIKMIFTDKTLRNRVLFMLGALAVFRLLSVIPIPGIDATKFQALIANNQFIRS
jgi:preprotein translocase subunit SecY